MTRPTSTARVAVTVIVTAAQCGVALWLLAVLVPLAMAFATRLRAFGAMLGG